MQKAQGAQGSITPAQARAHGAIRAALRRAGKRVLDRGEAERYIRGRLPALIEVARDAYRQEGLTPPTMYIQGHYHSGNILFSAFTEGR